MVAWAIRGWLVVGLVALAGAAAAEPVVPPLVRALWPEVAADAVGPGPLPGWLEIVTPDGQVAYLDPSQRHVVVGQWMDLWTRQNLSQERVARKRGQVVGEIPAADVLWLRPSGAPVGRLYVFDDPDCPYCRQAHSRLGELVARGVEVGVVLYPVVRLHPQAYAKSAAIWCATEPARALDQAMAGAELTPPERPCAHPIDRNLLLGRRLGVTGTPFWVAPAGRTAAGVRSLEELLALSGVTPAEERAHPAQAGHQEDKHAE